MSEHIDTWAKDIMRLLNLLEIAANYLWNLIIPKGKLYWTMQVLVVQVTRDGHGWMDVIIDLLN